MNFEIKFTPQAEETYVIVVEQLRQRWGDQFVLKLEARISKCLDILSSTPHLYPIIDAATGIRRCVLHKNCSMLYAIYGHTIHIALFWDNRQNPIFTS